MKCFQKATLSGEEAYAWQPIGNLPFINLKQNRGFSSNENSKANRSGAILRLLFGFSKIAVSSFPGPTPSLQISANLLSLRMQNPPLPTTPSGQKCTPYQAAPI